MDSRSKALNRLKKENNVIVKDNFFEFDTEKYENEILAKRPWRSE